MMTKADAAKRETHAAVRRAQHVSDRTVNMAQQLRRRLEKIVTEADVAEARFEIEAWWAARQQRLSELPWSKADGTGDSDDGRDTSL